MNTVFPIQRTTNSAVALNLCLKKTDKKIIDRIIMINLIGYEKIFRKKMLLYFLFT